MFKKVNTFNSDRMFSGSNLYDLPNYENSFHFRRGYYEGFSLSRKHISKFAVVAFVVAVIVLLIYVIYRPHAFRESEGFIEWEFDDVEKTPYILDTPNCRIKNRHLFQEDFQIYNSRKKFPVDYNATLEPGQCDDLPPLSSVSRAGVDGHKLHLHRENFHFYLTHEKKYKVVGGNLTCCFAYISYSKDEAENSTAGDPRYTNCTTIQDDVEMDAAFEFVVVMCAIERNPKIKRSALVYKSYHAFVTIKPEVRLKMEMYNESVDKIRKYDEEEERSSMDGRFSVMIVGLDSVSRLNFLRAMPETAEYLQDMGWVPLRGHSSVGPATWDNLAAAVLAGYTKDQLEYSCDEHYDLCPWIWNRFSESGYITAYGEDSSARDTFSDVKGFIDSPTDYYLKPFMNAASTDTVEEDEDWTAESIRFDDCLGPVHESEHILNYSLEFASVFTGFPTFSLFWMSSFSRNRVEGPKVMDGTFRRYLEDLTASGSLNRTIVVLMSDNGKNFGRFRLSEMGFTESQLPLLYFWIPESFKNTYPAKVKNLIENGRKLTSHFDVHLTLRELAMDYQSIPGCPNCMSLFQPIPRNRTCADGGIPRRFCPCVQYVPERDPSPYQHLGEFLVNEINGLTANFEPEDFLLHENGCLNLTLEKIISLRWTFPGTYPSQELFSNGSQKIFLVSVETKPRAFFEAVIFYNETLKTDYILRLDRYDWGSRCYEGKGRQYCICDPPVEFYLKQGFMKGLRNYVYMDFE